MSIRNPARSPGPRESRAAGWKINPSTGQPIYHAPGLKPNRVDAKRRRIYARSNAGLSTLVSMRFIHRHLNSARTFFVCVAGDVAVVR